METVASVRAASSINLAFFCADSFMQDVDGEGGKKEKDLMCLFFKILNFMLLVLSFLFLLYF